MTDRIALYIYSLQVLLDPHYDVSAQAVLSDILAGLMLDQRFL